MRLILSITTDATDFDRRFDVSDERAAVDLLAETLADVEKRFLKKAPRQKDVAPVKPPSPPAAQGSSAAK
ncbi:MAG TPA: hypothetical protein VJ276_07345 [Thermoanaerobaculia bacterium]|nr:hypothetical protein [Thermoanaerobaculia bacterium]